jgi:hypothetical protein
MERNKHKGRVSRRDFLKGLAAGAGITLVPSCLLAGGYVADTLYPFSGLLSQEKPGSVRPEDLKELITVEDGIEIPVNYLENRKVFVDKEALSLMIFNISIFVFPSGGPEKVRAILKTKPLKIVLNSGEIGPVHEKKGDYYHPDASYFPFTSGGAMINFAGEFLRDYYLSQVTVNVDGQLINDSAIAHEIVHFMQDINCPLSSSIDSWCLWFARKRESLGLGKAPAAHETPYETEAELTADKFTGRFFDSYMAYSGPKIWPFGRVFNFV